MTALLLLLACDEPAPRETLQPVVSQHDAAVRDARRVVLKIDHVERKPPEDEDAPNVVMVVLDTFRADRLAAYGGDPSLAPRLNAFAEGARVYTEMRSTGSWTLPSHGSLFTGVHPIEHGARGSEADKRARAYKLHDDLPTLAERLAASGWITVGVAANRAFLDRNWGLNRGFDVWQCRVLEPVAGVPYVQGDRIAHVGVQAFRYNRNPSPLFLFLNFMDVHTPWIPREGYTKDPSRIDPLLLPQGGAWDEPSYWGKTRRAVLSEKRAPTALELSTWEESYDAEVRYLDEQFGALLDGLERHGFDDDDYLVVLSDHGEFLGEHNLIEHSKDLYEEVLEVPLLIRGPGFEPGIDTTPLTTADVPDLLLSALGLSPLAADPGDPELQVSELYWSRHRDLAWRDVAARFDRIKRSFRDGDHKLMLGENGEEQAFDLGADPRELSSVLDSAGWVPALRARADAWMTSRQLRTGEAVELDAEAEAQLRALGYVD